MDPSKHLAMPYLLSSSLCSFHLRLYCGAEEEEEDSEEEDEDEDEDVSADLDGENCDEEECDKL